MKNKYFPCPVCKTTGIVEEGDTQDGIQISPDLDCGYCEGDGFIEIDGKRHMEIKRQNIAIDAIDKFKPKKSEYSWEELQNIGKKIEKLILT